MITDLPDLIPKLTITQYELMVRLGWPEEERAIAQKVHLSFVIEFSQLPNACQDDDLASTVCYQTLLLGLKEYLQLMQFKLLEHLSLTIYRFVRQSLPTQCTLQLSVTKYPLICGLTQGVTFSCDENTCV
jgi:FolB domain-containing protein